MPNTPHLVKGIEKLHEELRPRIEGMSIPMLRGFKAKHLIPFVSAGFRTHFYDPDAVFEAIQKLTVQPHAQKKASAK